MGFLYLLAALAVGAYLILAVADVGRATVVYSGWEQEELQVAWMTQIAGIYGGLALAVTIGYVCALMLVFDRLPSVFCLIGGSIPWIGSTTRIVAMGEFCQSIYQSVLGSRTYDDALAQASDSIRHAGLRRWSRNSSKRIESGQPLGRVLRSSPIQEQPLSAVAAFLTKEMSTQDAILVWHRATSECHLLAQSRLDRTTQFMSITFMLASVLIAAFAMLLSGTMMRVVLQGWSWLL